MQIYVIYNKGRVGYIFKVYLKVSIDSEFSFFMTFFILTFYLFLFNLSIFYVHEYSLPAVTHFKLMFLMKHQMHFPCNHFLLVSPSPTSVPPIFHSLFFYFHVIYRCVCMIPDMRENMLCLSSRSGFLCLLWWPPILCIFLKIAQLSSSSWQDYALLCVSNTFALAVPCWNP